MFKNKQRRSIPALGLLTTTLTWNQLKLLQKGLIRFGLAEFAEYMRSMFMVKYCFAGNTANCASLQIIRHQAIDFDRISFASFTQRAILAYFKMNKQQRQRFKFIVDPMHVIRASKMIKASG